MSEIRTDLAIEAHEMCSKEKAEAKSFSGIDVAEYEKDGVFVTVIKVLDENGSKILSKPIGTYATIEAPQIKFSEEVYQSACLEIANQIKKLYSITEKTKTLVVGLGNKMITPDALGPAVVSKLMITNHIKTNMKEYLDDSYSAVCAIIPGVLGTTGIETTQIIKGVVDRIKPEVVICVDALAARSMERVSTAFQISDTGINPGSGVENKREGINEETLGVKVIAIGVPTVVDAATIAIDSIEFAASKNKLTPQNKDGIIRDVLTKNAKNMMVTPKDIDLVIDRCAKTVANGINMALHKNISFKDIESYVG
jgi:spore protease